MASPASPAALDPTGMATAASPVPLDRYGTLRRARANARPDSNGTALLVLLLVEQGW